MGRFRSVDLCGFDPPFGGFAAFANKCRVSNSRSCKRLVCPVWMTSALQGKNALIARLVSTVLCPAFDRGVDVCRWP